jgi:hypothetical protein
LTNDGTDIGGVAETRQKYWRKLIAEQEASGQKARPFCRERGIGEYSFYKWRQRLRQSDTVQFALLETLPAATSSLESALQVVATTLRMVLEVVRGLYTCRPACACICV